MLKTALVPFPGQQHCMADHDFAAIKHKHGQRPATLSPELTSCQVSSCTRKSRPASVCSDGLQWFPQCGNFTQKPHAPRAPTVLNMHSAEVPCPAVIAKTLELSRGTHQGGYVIKHQQGMAALCSDSLGHGHGCTAGGIALPQAGPRLAGHHSGPLCGTVPAEGCLGSFCVALPAQAHLSAAAAQPWACTPIGVSTWKSRAVQQ